MTAVDYQDWSAPQAHATAIAGTGVPLLTVPSLLVNLTQTVNAGADILSPAYAMPQVAYEIALFAIANGSGSAAPLLVNMIWRDSTNTFLLGNEEWWIWPGNTGGTHQIIGTGPCKGANLFIELKNTSSAMSYSVQYVLYARSNVYTRDDWRSVAYTTTVSGQTVIASDPSALQNAYVSQSVGAGANAIFELPLIAGNCFFHADSASNTNDLVVAFQNSANPNGSGLGSTLAKYRSDANGFVNGNIALPRFQNRVAVSNTNAAAKVITFSLVYQDAAS
jgi:hypothetical protein